MIGFSKDLILVATDQTTGDYKCTAVVEGFPPARSQPARLSLVTKPLIISKKVETSTLEIIDHPFAGTVWKTWS